MNLLNILLMGGGGNGQDPTQSFIMIILIMVVFYVFMILPQMRKTKAQKKFREELQKGDKVVNIAGIHGKILDMDDTTMLIELEGGVKMRIEKSSVSMEATQALKKKDEKK